MVVPPVKLDIVNDRPVRGSASTETPYTMLQDNRIPEILLTKKHSLVELFLMPSRQLLRYVHLEAS